MSLAGYCCVSVLQETNEVVAIKKFKDSEGESYSAHHTQHHHTAHEY